MNTSYSWKGVPPKLPRGAVAQVVDALVPMLMWNAPVTRVTSHGLSTIERFIIEAALDLSTISATDIAEVTGLPVDVAIRVTSRVAAIGVLERIPDAPNEQSEPTFRPVISVATETLNSAVLREYHSDELSVLYLPRTDEIVAFEPAGPKRSGPPLLHKLVPEADAPLPSDMVGRRYGDLLHGRIDSGAVIDLPDWVYSAEPDDRKLPETCHAYHCCGHLKDTSLVLKLVDAENPSRKQPCNLSGAVGLARWLAKQVKSIEGAFSGWGASSVSPQRLPAGEDVTWAFSVYETLARRAMHDDLTLTRPLGLTIHDEEAIVSVGVRLLPADDAARKVFALDHAVNAVLATPLSQLGSKTLDAVLTEADASHDHRPTTQQVQKELWRRRKFYHVYALRVSDDFAYD